MDESTNLGIKEQRELAQAMVVHRMNAKERGLWLGQQITIVQAQLQLMMQHFPARPGARSFALMAEKNRYDEQRELGLLTNE